MAEHDEVCMFVHCATRRQEMDGGGGGGGGEDVMCSYEYSEWRSLAIERP